MMFLIGLGVGVAVAYALRWPRVPTTADPRLYPSLAAEQAACDLDYRKERGLKIASREGLDLYFVEDEIGSRWCRIRDGVELEIFAHSRLRHGSEAQFRSERMRKIHPKLFPQHASS